VAAEALPGTTCGGEKLAVAPVGSPLTLMETTPVNGVDCGAREKLYVAMEPGCTVCVVLPLVASVKSGMTRTIAVIALELLGVKLASPL
jgi:hypothetical protein